MKKQRNARSMIFGTGLVALDLVISADASQPVWASTGGTCANVLAILSFLGWDSYPIARLNGDAASLRVKADLQRWGVHLDYAECAPTSPTPIIIQEIRRDKYGIPKHRFSWSCPTCGKWLPAFKPVTINSVELLVEKMNEPKVFFMDRLSRASLILAAAAKEHGAIVVFEPSANSDPKLLNEALQLSDIVKYSNQRLSGLAAAPSSLAVPIEIQTLGAKGLRYRSRLPKARTRDWKHLDAVPVPVLADTCGAGDWCTAGIIYRIGSKGAAGLKQVSGAELRDALRFGQALASWNCGFEGARGGMYRTDKTAFQEQVRRILKGNPEHRADTVHEHLPSALIPCPACSPSG